MKTLFKRLFITAVCIITAISALKADNMILLTGRSLSIKSYNEYTGQWGPWSEWTSCSVRIMIDLDNDMISILSSKAQYYKVLIANDPYIDSDGDSVMVMKCRDSRNTNCTLRLIVRRDSTAQLYIDYSDYMWVYNVIRD